MAQLIRFIRTLRSKDEDGQTLVEYGLLLAFIALVVIAALMFIGPIVSGTFQEMGESLQNT